MADDADAALATLRAQALAPGGYARDGARLSDRPSAWARLLALPPPPTEGSPAELQDESLGQSPGCLQDPRKDLEDLPAHPDERQVGLDVRRSFASGWVSEADLPARRAQLYEVIVSVLRAVPSLAYYQGYHDVVSVLLLTLAPRFPREPSEGTDRCTSITWEGRPARWASAREFALVWSATRRVSLHVLRDYMAASFAPSMSHLSLLSSALETQPTGPAQGPDAPGPVYALSWLLTFFAHDMDLGSAQRVMDCVLAYGPRMVIWIATAMLQVRVGEIGDPPPDWDAAAWHGALQQLPQYVPDCLSSPACTSESSLADQLDASGGEAHTQDETEAKGSLAGGDSSPPPSASGRSSPDRHELVHTLRAKPSSLALIRWDEPDETFEDPDVSLPHERFLLAPVAAPTQAEPDAQPETQTPHVETRRSGRQGEGGSAGPRLCHILSEARQMQLLHDEVLPVEQLLGPRSVLLTWPSVLGTRPDTGRDECEWRRLDEEAVQHLRSLGPVPVQPELPTVTKLARRPGKYILPLLLVLLAVLVQIWVQRSRRSAALGL